jgi:regulator of protease activity HflC (stomatin/prohibitin superfamily)
VISLVLGLDDPVRRRDRRAVVAVIAGATAHRTVLPAVIGAGLRAQRAPVTTGARGHGRDARRACRTARARGAVRWGRALERRSRRAVEAGRVWSPGVEGSRCGSVPRQGGDEHDPLVVRCFFIVLLGCDRRERDPGGARVRAAGRVPARTLSARRGPGLVLLIPLVDRAVKVGLRTVTWTCRRRTSSPRDNVTVKVNAVIYFRVIDAQQAVIQVENYLYATSQIAQTTLRSILGQQELDELLSEREKLNQALQQVIDRQTEPWGVKVSTVEVKNVDLPQEMQRAIARQAEAERERRAKVINAEGEYQAAQRLAEAAAVHRARAGGASAALPADAGGDRDREQLDHHLPGPDRLPQESS